MKNFLLLLLYLLITNGVLFSQNKSQLYSEHKVEVHYEQDQNQNYVFYATNKELCDYTITIYFIVLDNLKSSMPVPYTGTVKPGRNNLFMLSPKYKSTHTNFRYDYSYIKGSVSNLVDPEFPYLLPVAHTKETEVFEFSPLSSFFGKDDPPSSWCAYGFKMADSDTIYAARSGIVVELNDKSDSKQTENIFSREENYIEISHKDCTFGKYQVLKKGSALVKVGQQVYAGQPIALAGGKNYQIGPHVRFLVYYLPKLQKLPTGFDPQKIYWSYIPLKFWVNGGKQSNLEEGKVYKSQHPESLITLEMSKREKKKREKN
jgi:hypothetical protein